MSTEENQKEKRLRLDEQIQNPYVEQPMPQVGDKIGPNRVELLVGEGGSANVYKVWHEGLEVVRAIKVLKKAFHQESCERFLTEAKILADINHPNIVEIHNLGYLHQKIPFIEMEFVEGSSIKKLLNQNKKFPLPVAISVAYFVGQALQYTHVKDYTLYGKVYHGLIHRDIKPENIVISSAGVVKLMDFGVARPSEVSLHTVGSKIVGTLVYLSPEQLNGQQLDHRSDIFSLGTVLYEMLTGNRAFPHKSLQDLVQKKMKGEFQPITEHGISFPRSVVNIIHKSLSLKPENRHASAKEFCQELFAAFHEVTDRSPHDVISRFMSNPTSFSDWRPRPASAFKLVFLGIGIALAAIVGIVAAIFLK